MARRRKLISEAEYQEYQQLLQQYEPRPKRRKQAVEPDYGNMELAEFGQHIQATSQECMELGISSGFAAARAFDRGDYVSGTVRTCEAVVGVASVVAIVAQLLGAASGRD